MAFSLVADFGASLNHGISEKGIAVRACAFEVRIIFLIN